MLEINWLVLALSALISLLVGFIYYHPKVLGNAWMKTAHLSEEQLKTGNMAVIFILVYIMSFLIAMMLQFVVIHQFHMMSTLANDLQEGAATKDEAMAYLEDFYARFGDRFRTFKHGAFHGVLASLFFAMPILGINALFERKGFKYIAIHTGYWLITLALMGGVICAFS